MKPTTWRAHALPITGLVFSMVLMLAGCAANRAPVSELAVRGAIERYAADAAERLDRQRGERQSVSAFAATPSSCSLALDGDRTASLWEPEVTAPYFTLGLFPQESAGSSKAEPTASKHVAGAGVPEGYWRQNIWHQMGHEALELGGHDFWRGFKTSFWDLDNALLLTATMGASITIRGTGVDDTVARHASGHRQLGEFDESIQLMGNPATHFAGTGVLWLASALAQDAKEHEVAKALTQALAVNGVTTLVLKGVTNTHAPNGESLSWPSGHTSSSFTVAAVINEYYGPLAGIPCFALAGLVGYQRLDSRVHDFSDVVFGAMLGYVVGTSIARDEQARFPEIFGMKVVPFADPETGATGLALMKSW